VQDVSGRPSLPNTSSNMMMPKSDLEREIEEILAKSRQKQAGESSSAKKKKKKKKRRPISQDSQELTTASKANEATSTKLYE